MMKATYEECARDKLDDRTATCVPPLREDFMLRFQRDFLKQEQ